MLTVGLTPSSSGNSNSVSADTCSCTPTSNSALRSAKLSPRTDSPAPYSVANTDPGSVPGGVPAGADFSSPSPSLSPLTPLGLNEGPGLEVGVTVS